MTGVLRPRAAALAAICALLAAGCGGGGEPELASTGTSAVGTEPSEGAVDAAVPAAAAPVAPAPARSPETAVAPPEVEATVPLAEPDLLVRPGSEGSAALETVTSLKQVDHVAAGSEFTARFVVPADTVPGLGGGSEESDASEAPPEDTEVAVLGIDPATFRPLTPEVTAQEPGVWERLLDGDVVVRHDVAQKLGLELGETYRLVGPAGEVDARIGALASNGAPPLAEVLVPWEVATQLGAGDINLLVISAASDTDADALGESVVGQLDGADVEVRSAPEEQQARIVSTGRHDFEPFTFTDLGDGMIVIDPNWVARWIAPVEIPGLGTTRCHRVMIPQLLAALQEIQEAGLYGHFKPSQFGGCYMPRHIDWDPSKPLSMHAWGLAIDFNTHDNWLGQTPQMDRRIVAIFERWGFEWGGHWSRPDGMHFELDRVIDVGG